MSAEGATLDRTQGGQPSAVSEDASARTGAGGRSDALSNRRFWLIAAALLALSLVVRAVYVLHTTGFHVTNDDRSYDTLARTLALGHGWAYGNSAYRPPAYPIFLAGVYLLTGIPHGVWTAARLVEALLSTVTVGLIGVMALQVAGRRAMLLSMAIAAIYVPLVLVGVSLMTESLFVPLTLVSVNCALRTRTTQHRYRWVVVAGFSAGLASLTRGNGLVLGLALLPLIWGRPLRSWRALAAPAILLVVMALTISPWTIRNASAQHAFVPVTTELGPTLAGTYNDLSAKTRYVWHIAGFHHNYRSIMFTKGLNGAQTDSRLTSAVITYIGHHPAALPEAMFWNTMRLLDLQGRRISRMTAYADTNATAGMADLGVVIFWIFGALAILGAVVGAARGIPLSFWFVPFVLWLSVAPVTTGTPRFRAVLDPFVIILAALAIQRLAPALLPGRLRSASRSGTRVAAATT